MSDTKYIDSIVTFIVIFFILMICFLFGFRGYCIGYDRGTDDMQKTLIEKNIMEYDSKTGKLEFKPEFASTDIEGEE